MNDETLEALLESLKNAKNEANKADATVKEIEAELPQAYWDALKVREAANKIVKTNETNVRNGAQEYYEANGALPVTPYLQTGISVSKSVANTEEVLMNVIERILAGEKDLIAALQLDEAIVAEYPDLGAQWDEKATVTTRIQWKALEK